MVVPPGLEPRYEDFQSSVLPLDYRTKDDEQIRTAVNGFADRCLTTRPQRQEGEHQDSNLDRLLQGRVFPDLNYTHHEGDLKITCKFDLTRENSIIRS